MNRWLLGHFTGPRGILLIAAILIAALGAAPPARAGSEAPPPMVQSIAVRGHDRVPVEQILDAITATRPGRLLDPETLEHDAQAILDLGTFENVTFQTVAVPGGLQVVFWVKELPVLTRVLFQGLEGRETAGLLAESGLEIGRVIDLNQVREALTTVSYQVLERDGLLVQPNKPPIWDQEGNLTLFFAPVRLRQMRVEGNEKTQEHVIVREMGLQPGDPIDLNIIDRGLRDVLQLGFFDQVSRSFEETGDPESLDLVIHVEERMTGAAAFAPGWSSRAGFFGRIDVSEKNFLGRGQEVGALLEVGRSHSDYELRFREPYLTPSGLSLEIRLFQWNRIDPSHLQVQGVLFVDSGRAWTEGEPVRLSDLATGYGLGIRFMTPLGFLRLDYGMRPDASGQIHLSVGQDF